MVQPLSSLCKAQSWSPALKICYPKFSEELAAQPSNYDSHSVTNLFFFLLTYSFETVLFKFKSNNTGSLKNPMTISLKINNFNICILKNHISQFSPLKINTVTII